MLTFDHVAIGVRDHRPALHALTESLGGLVISGGQPPGSGFRTVQIRLGRDLAGMTVELIEPYDAGSDNFLERFLDANGDGPHHMTFKTDDIESELDRLRGIGVEPVAIDFSSPSWREMFIHPKRAHGTVVQIAQTDKPDPPMDEWIAGLPESLVMYDGDRWWGDPSVSTGNAAEMMRVVIETADRAEGDAFYSAVLGSEPQHEESHTDHSWAGGVVRLVDAPVDRPRIARLDVSGASDAVSIGAAQFVPVG